MTTADIMAIINMVLKTVVLLAVIWGIVKILTD